MEKMRMLMANGLAGSLDLAMGALIAAAVLSLFGVHPALWQLALGSIFAVLPDFDIVLPILAGREVVGDHHTTLMHRPLFVIPAASLAAYAVAGSAWELVAFLCVTWHYLHDSPMLGSSGVAWLWPLNKTFGTHGPIEPGMTHYAWLKKYWLTLSPRLCIEVGAGLMALALAIFIATAWR